MHAHRRRVAAIVDDAQRPRVRLPANAPGEVDVEHLDRERLVARQVARTEAREMARDFVEVLLAVRDVGCIDVREAVGIGEGHVHGREGRRRAKYQGRE